MQISYHVLKSLPVETPDGVYLGKVRDVIIDVDTHAVKQYEVKSSRLGGRRYLIVPEDIVSITKEKITVRDATLTERTDSGGMKRVAPSASPALGSSMD